MQFLFKGETCLLIPFYITRFRAMKNILKQLSIGFTLGTSLLVSATLPAQAQTGNASDVTGAIITTGDIAGGAFAPTLIRDNAALLAALRQAVRIISAQLAQGTLPITLPGVAVASVPVAVQQALLAVLIGSGDAAGIESAIAAGITDPSLARELAAILQGLFADETVSPANLLAVIEAYNAFIDASSGEALSNPSPTLLTVQSVLTALVSAASTAQ